MSIKIKDAYELYKNGWSLSKIQKEYHVSRHRLSKEFKKMGENILANGQKYNYNQNIFEQIDTEQKAYWLGFLYADGYIKSEGKLHQVELALQESDYNHLITFRNFIGDDSIPINYRKDIKAYRIVICSKKIVQDLIKLGCFQKKSYILKFPTREQIPECLIHHFMRGYFDGDGSITKNTVSIIGTSDFLDGYEKYLLLALNRNNPNKREHDKRWHENIQYIRYGGKKQVNKIFNFLYNNATVYLQRKYDKFNILPSQNETINNSEIISAELSGEPVKSRDTQPEPKANSDISQGQRIDDDPLTTD